MILLINIQPVYTKNKIYWFCLKVIKKNDHYKIHPCISPFRPAKLFKDTLASFFRQTLAGGVLKGCSVNGPEDGIHCKIAYTSKYWFHFQRIPASTTASALP